MRILGCTYALAAVASIAACQARASEAPPAGPEPILARDGAGAVLATITRTHPCDAQVAGVHALIEAKPLLADLGADRWSGETTASGTLLRKGPDLAARVVDGNGVLSVFDPAGAAWIRVDARGTVHGAGGQLLRSVRADGSTLHVGDAVVTGTQDVVLAAALVSPEVPAEVRALVACNHLLPAEAVP